ELGVAVSERDGGRRRVERLDEPLEEERLPDVVRVEERQELIGAREREPEVASRARPAVRPPDERDARVGDAERAAARLVRRLVVDDDELEVAERLAEDGPERLGDRLLAVERRHDDRDARRS